jgi:hypothetical protein
MTKQQLTALKLLVSQLREAADLFYEVTQSSRLTSELIDELCQDCNVDRDIFTIYLIQDLMKRLP